MASGERLFNYKPQKGEGGVEMEPDYKIYIKLFRLFLARFTETGEWFIGLSKDNCYKILKVWMKNLKEAKNA